MTKLAILGCDSSHAIAFGDILTKRINNSLNKVVLKGVWCQHEHFAKKTALQLNIQNFNNLDELMEDVDGAMLLNRFGEERYKIAKKILKYQKPIFADKPITMNINDAKKLFDLYHDSHIPLISASAFRFAPDLQKFKKNISKFKVLGGLIIGPSICKDLGDDPRLKNAVFYGIHVTEMINELFGNGFKIKRLERNYSSEFYALIENDYGLKLNLNFIDQKIDYYHITVFTDRNTLSFTLNTNGNYYEKTLNFFIDFIKGKNQGIDSKNTLEALSIILEINLSPAKRQPKII